MSEKRTLFSPIVLYGDGNIGIAVPIIVPEIHFAKMVEYMLSSKAVVKVSHPRCDEECSRKIIEIISIIRKVGAFSKIDNDAARAATFHTISFLVTKSLMYHVSYVTFLLLVSRRIRDAFIDFLNQYDIVSGPWYVRLSKIVKIKNNKYLTNIEKVKALSEDLFMDAILIREKAYEFFDAGFLSLPESIVRATGEVAGTPMEKWYAMLFTYLAQLHYLANGFELMYQRTHYNGPVLQFPILTEYRILYRPRSGDAFYVDVVLVAKMVTPMAVLSLVLGEPGKKSEEVVEDFACNSRGVALILYGPGASVRWATKNVCGRRLVRSAPTRSYRTNKVTTYVVWDEEAFRQVLTSIRDPVTEVRLSMSKS